MNKQIVVLGSTGSIGTQTLDCVRNLKYGVQALAAHKNIRLLEMQAREFSPRCVVVTDENAYRDIKVRLADTAVQVRTGEDALCEIAQDSQSDLICNALVGIVGLKPTLAALEAKKDIALSNKETLAAGGRLVLETAGRTGARLLPVDSEHSAIFQSLQGCPPGSLVKILLTASGGPFRGKTAEQLEQVTREQALQHPNWVMGAKVTIDSSTLMNKGLELMEAVWLFGVCPEQVEVVVHPQSVIHSAIELVDGAVLAQLGVSDMHIPIQYALTWPGRAPTETKRLSLTDWGTLTFEKPDLEAFGCLRACIRAMQLGGLAPCAVNAANEQAVQLFLQNQIRWADIARAVCNVAARFETDATDRGYTLEEILNMDTQARMAVLEYFGI